MNLLNLEGIIEGVKNYSVAVMKNLMKVIFLRKIVEGGADQSYGIEVAKLAGLPEDVIERAKEILQKLEGEKSFDETHELFNNHNVSRKDIEEKNTQAEINTEEEIQESVIEIKEAAAVDLEITPTKEDRISVANNTTVQMDFAMIEKDALIKEISAIEIMTMTPLDAMNKLFEIVQKSKNM